MTEQRITEFALQVVTNKWGLSLEDVVKLSIYRRSLYERVRWVITRVLSEQEQDLAACDTE